MKKLVGSIVGNILSIFGVTLSDQSLENLDHVMSIVCMVIGIAITIITAIIIPLIKWWKKAKEDGKITRDELQDGIDIAKGGIDSVKDVINKKDKEEK